MQRLEADRGCWCPFPDKCSASGVALGGSPMEGFIRSAARLAADHEPTIDQVLEIAERHGIEMLGPVPDIGLT
jgi:hypothetical protein